MPVELPAMHLAMVHLHTPDTGNQHVSASDVNQVDFVSKAGYMPMLDGGQMLQAYNSSSVSRD